MTGPRVTNIKVKQALGEVEFTFDTGEGFQLPAELLRVESPSAEVQGHGEGKTVVHGKRNVAITSIEPVGNYAVRIDFDDGHDTGIYSWEYLYWLGEEHGSVWHNYLAALQAKGLSRDA